jgi:hypothetical protein
LVDEENIRQEICDSEATIARSGDVVDPTNDCNLAGGREGGNERENEQTGKIIDESVNVTMLEKRRGIINPKSSFHASSVKQQSTEIRAIDGESVVDSMDEMGTSQWMDDTCDLRSSDLTLEKVKKKEKNKPRNV